MVWPCLTYQFTVTPGGICVSIVRLLDKVCKGTNLPWLITATRWVGDGLHLRTIIRFPLINWVSSILNTFQDDCIIRLEQGLSGTVVMRILKPLRLCCVFPLRSHFGIGNIFISPPHDSHSGVRSHSLKRNAPLPYEAPLSTFLPLIRS